MLAVSSKPAQAWPREPLGTLGRWVGGGTPSKANALYWTDGTTPWVSAKDMKTTVIRDTVDNITADAVRSSPAKPVPPGSVLCVMRSGILAHTFPVAVNEVEVTINQDLRALVPREDVSASYVAHFLRFSAGEILRNCSKHGTTVASVEAPRLNRVLVPLPGIEIQRRIAERIDELFAEIDDGEEELRRARQELETYRNSLLKAAVTGELTTDWRAVNPPRETGEQLLQRILNERQARWDTDSKKRGKRYKEPISPSAAPSLLPSGWTWASLDQLSWASSYGTSEKCDAQSAGEPVLRIPNLRAGDIDLSKLKYARTSLSLSPTQYVSPGDLLIVRTNGSEDLIGRSAVVIDRLKRPTHFASYLIRFRLHGHANLWRWVRAFTESAVFRASVWSSIGSSAGQYNLSMSKLASFPIAVPPTDEIDEALTRWHQRQIGIDSGIEATAAHLRQSILAAAFRGELIS